MKHSWLVVGLLLLLVAGIGSIVYLLSRGTVMSVPMMLLVWLLVFGIFALGGGIAWLAGWLPQKKMTTTLNLETEPKGAAIKVPKEEPTHPTEATATEMTKASPILVVESRAEAGQGQVKEETKVEPTQMAEEIKAEPSKALEEKTEEEPSQGPVKEATEPGFKIIDIEGIGPVHAKKLNAINIYTASDLLEAGATSLGRKELEERTGISHKHILEWVNIADLLRIRGVGEEYSDLLEEAGVDTVLELSRRIPENLHAKLLEVNEKKHFVRRTPSLNQVAQWIEEAKKLPRKIEY